jgi:hypothetical protein
LVYKGEEELDFIPIYTTTLKEVFNDIIVFISDDYRHEFLNIYVEEHITISWVHFGQLNK